MSDREILDACAEAMGITDDVRECIRGGYSPLTDDAQAMALVKRFNLSIERGGQNTDGPWWRVANERPQKAIIAADLNRAICLCVARMKGATKGAEGEK